MACYTLVCPHAWRSTCTAAQVYALAFWYGGRLVAWHEASFGDILKVHSQPVPVAPPFRDIHS